MTKWRYFRRKFDHTMKFRVEEGTPYPKVQMRVDDGRWVTSAWSENGFGIAFFDTHEIDPDGEPTPVPEYDYVTWAPGEYFHGDVVWRFRRGSETGEVARRVEDGKWTWAISTRSSFIAEDGFVHPAYNFSNTEPEWVKA